MHGVIILPHMYILGCSCYTDTHSTHGCSPSICMMGQESSRLSLGKLAQSPAICNEVIQGVFPQKLLVLSSEGMIHNR